MSEIEFPNIEPGASLPDAIQTLVSADIKVAHVGLVDLYGCLRERRVSVADLVDIGANGATFANVLPHWDASEQVFGAGPFGGEIIAIDTASFRPYPFEPNACLVFADYIGPSRAWSARALLEAQIAKLVAAGYQCRVAFETEFIVLQESAVTLREKEFDRLQPFAPDNRCWAAESAAAHGELIADLSSFLMRGGLQPFSIGFELGPGCIEATMRDTSPLKAANDMLAFKLYTKGFFRRRGMTAAFMAQLSKELSGLSQHIHFSLCSPNGAQNLSIADGAMTPDMQNFVAGIITLIPDAMALTHSNPNSYRRIAPGNWAPKTASWAEQNYAAAVRFVSSPESHGRLEYRLPGADANPYLSLAFVLGAGLWGINNQSRLPPPLISGSPLDSTSTQNTLSHDLYEATRRLDASTLSREIWGQEFVQQFVRVLQHEEASLRRDTSPAERSRYLEIL